MDFGVDPGARRAVFRSHLGQTKVSFKGPVFCCEVVSCCFGSFAPVLDNLAESPDAHGRVSPLRQVIMT